MSKFKVGDRVRLLVDNGSDGRWGVKGEAGTVVVADDGRDDSRVNFDYSGLWYASWCDLDFTTPTLTIESGKYYKTRDGRKVGPVRVDSSTFGPYDFRGVENYGECRDLWIPKSGKRINHGVGYDIGLDFIAEWVEPVAEATATFKVGDRVRLNCDDYSTDQSRRGTGTVVGRAKGLSEESGKSTSTIMTA